MKTLIIISLLVVSVAFFASFKTNNGTPDPLIEKTFQDSIEADKLKYINLIKESIKGKENMRADSVFKNIKMLKVPAGRLLAIMNMGYSRALGVSCGHCHNTSDFSSEEIIQKEVTRQMADMASKINNDLLKKIDGVKPELLIINCTTCHRGEVKPALNMPVPPKN